jgi:Tol biopolymer transport system component
MALGTPAYMSPEQATADQKVDQRADIYSVGALAYELLTGRTPFRGANAQEQMVAQLTGEVESIRSFRPSVSPELESVVLRCLAKNPADRWQTAEELLPYLEAARTPSGGIESIAAPPPGRNRVTTALVGTAAIAGALFVGLQLLGREPLSITTGAMLQVTSEPGLEFQPALSPDGSEIAYVEGPIGRARVVVRTVSVDGGAVRPTEGLEGLHVFPSWKPSGESIRFAACPWGDWGQRHCTWREVGKLGGVAGTLSSAGVTDRYAWSRDGTRIVSSSGTDSIFTWSTDDPSPELLTAHVAGASRPHSFDWSPDGRRIAYVDRNLHWRVGGDPASSAIWVVDPLTGESARITEEGSLNQSPQWLPDSRHLLFVSNRDGALGIYVVEIGPNGPAGEPQSVLSGSDAHTISISHDGSKLAYSKLDLARNLRSVALPARGVGSLLEARRITTGNQIIGGHDLSRDGRWLVFDSNRRGGGVDLYRVSPEGGRSELVLDQPQAVGGPNVSPDGTEIAFDDYVDESQLNRINVMPAEGGVPLTLAEFSGEVNAADWAPDGLTLAFQTFGNEGSWHSTIWTVTRDEVGGSWSPAQELSDLPCFWPEWSADGEMLLCWLYPDPQIALMSRSGEVLDVLNAPNGKAESYWQPEFSWDGSLIYYIAQEEDGTEGIWSIPVSGGDPTPVIVFDDPAVEVSAPFTVGPDAIYVTVSEYESDIWVADLVY